MEAALEDLGLPRDADFILGVAGLDEQFSLLLPVIKLLNSKQILSPLSIYNYILIQIL